MHSNITIKNVSWPHFSWPTLYISDDDDGGGGGGGVILQPVGCGCNGVHIQLDEHT